MAGTISGLQEHFAHLASWINLMKTLHAFLSFSIIFFINVVHIFRLFMKLVREGKDDYKMKASDLPSFLYTDGTVYDKENLDTGLFQGHVLVRVRYFFLVDF